jgi:hypothetical protein
LSDFCPWKLGRIEMSGRWRRILRRLHRNKSEGFFDVTTQDQSQTSAGLMVGRRILRMKTGFLSVLMSKGVHHYFVDRDALPEDCRIVDASVNFSATLGAEELVLLLESEEWEPIEGVPAPEIKPLFIKHHCR